MNDLKKAREISASILGNVLQIGHLDYAKTILGLMDLTGSVEAQFFQNVYGLTFVCKYSNTSAYKIGELYTVEKLPPNKYVIYHRNNIIAIVCLDKQEGLETFPEDIQRRIHDSICIGLVMGNLKDSKYNFTMSVCNALGNIVNQVIQSFDSLTTKSRNDPRIVERINSYLNDVITIIYDTIDYLEIDAEKVSLQKNVVNMSTFVAETVGIVQDMFSIKVTTDLSDSANRSLVFDRKWVQQMIVSLLKKLNDISDIKLHIQLIGTVLVFHIYSIYSRNNAEIQSRLQVENVTVSTLDIFVIKKLCEIMNGTFSMDDEGEGAIIKITISLS